jgi:hypothetical protein
MDAQPLDHISLSAFYPLTVLLLTAAFLGGYLYARQGPGRKHEGFDTGVGAITGATLALLTFLLAFVVGFGVNASQERRMSTTAEANAIGTAWLRAGYLDDEYRGPARDLLREYVDQRVAVALDRTKFAEVRGRSEEIHAELWAQVEEIVRGGNTAPTTGLYISALNEVIDLHTERVVVGVYVRIPPFVLLSMFVIAVVAVFMVGIQTGYAVKRDFVALALLLLVLAFVLYLIVDLDRSTEGLLRANQQALFDLQTQLHSAP